MIQQLGYKSQSSGLLSVLGQLISRLWVTSLVNIDPLNLMLKAAVLYVERINMYAIEWSLVILKS